MKRIGANEFKNGRGKGKTKQKGKITWFNVFY